MCRVTGETGLGYLFSAVGLGAFWGCIDDVLDRGLSALDRLYCLLMFFLAYLWLYGHFQDDDLSPANCFSLGLLQAVHIALGIAVIQVNVPAVVRGGGLLGLMSWLGLLFR
ncbi:MAG: hypothetical protein Ct9H300mP19_04070 [Dehalococcoidia bacterium]|nr:MAG: hypothetical protein Ct9H300mP19_04070 [Dehalococcoidia bacterium]